MNCFNQSLSGRCRRGVVPLGWPSLEPPYRWPALQAGCQPRVSWSMLVKRTLIWVWQGNQQPNSTVKLNSAVEHHSASFMLRLQKGKVPQHQFVTESCGSERRLATKHRERNRERERVFASVWSNLCAVFRYITSGFQQQEEGFTSVVWGGWMSKREE